MTSNPNKKYIDAFGAVVEFLNDLWSVYGQTKKVTPLALYHRLVQHIKFTDKEGIRKVVGGFSQFLSVYNDHILEDRLADIPRDTRILYDNSDRIYLDIQKFIYQADKPTKDAIRKHLLTISAILEPDAKKIEELSKKPSPLPGLTLPTDDTPEGKFISGIMTKAQTTMETVGESENPMAAVMKLLQSGIVQDMMAGMNQGLGSGEMDMSRMFKTLQTTMGAFTNMSQSSEPKIEEVVDAKPEKTD